MSKLILVLCLTFALRGYSQLPNNGFENWASDSWSNHFPLGWTTSGYGADSTSDASGGNKALMVWTWYTYAIGYAYNGQSAGSFDFHKAGTPFTQKANALTGMYKFDTANVESKDSAAVMVILKKYNSGLSKVDTVGFALVKLPPVNSYTPFTIPITDMMPGIDPDSVVVVVSSQKRLFDSGVGSAQNTCLSPFSDCAYLYIDDLSLSTPLGLIDISEYFKSSISPNPSNEKIHFNYSSPQSSKFEYLTVFDSYGSVCYSEKILPGYSLNITNFANGLYHYHIKPENSASISKGKFVVVK